MKIMRTQGAGTVAPKPLELRKRSRLSPILAAAIVTLALLSAVATFAVLTGLTPLEPTGKIIAMAIAVNGFLVLALLLLIAFEIAPLWAARRSGKAAARLHIRVVTMFCGLAAIPAVLVAVIASFTLNVGLDRWFSAHTRAVVDNAFSVARAYMDEHNQAIRYDILALSELVNRAQPIAYVDPISFQTLMTRLASLRGISALYLLHANGTIMQQSKVTRDFELPKLDVIAQAKESAEPILITPADSDFVGAIIKLQTYDDIYLYVTRPVDQNVTRAVREAQAATKEYRTMEQGRGNVQAAFGVTYAGVALILLLIAIWFGIAFANRLVAPIRRLIAAADRVSRGNLSVQVPVKPEEGDLANLGQTFNIMTGKLKSQRDDLLQANSQIDARRLFMEAVLSGVTAGIIGIDPRLKITLANPTALELLGEPEENVIGKPLAEVMPEIAGLLNEAETTQKFVQSEIQLRRGVKNYNLLVRVTGEKAAGPEHGYVVTLDDITDLVAAQRSSAWADVARRIAHEIKNPLTPIQLSAERLKRKYADGITPDERDVFDQCTDTIIRQVNDIGRMVDEFSSFARMPKAQFSQEDVGDLVRQVVFLMRVGNPDIQFSFSPPESLLQAECDRRLIAQAVTNLVKNAAEAIATTGDSKSGRIDVRVRLDDKNMVVIEVEDNGIGLPRENRQRLLEPYMTTREKGTGLGLAIVGKIMDEHNGTIELLDGGESKQRRGALIRLTFPPRQQVEIPLTNQTKEMSTHVH